MTEKANEFTADSGWIPVTDKLPEPEQMVLVVRQRQGYYRQEFFVAECWQRPEVQKTIWHDYAGCTIHRVTHWQPLPPPPQAEAQDGQEGKG